MSGLETDDTRIRMVINIFCLPCIAIRFMFIAHTRMLVAVL